MDTNTDTQGTRTLDVVGLHLSSIGFQRSGPKSGCSSGQWAHHGCSHQTTVPVKFLPATKVARGPKLSVEKIFADSYICFRSQQAGLLQQHPVRGHGWEVGSTTVRSQCHSATGPQPSEVLANYVGHPRWATLAPCCVSIQYKLCIIVRNCLIGSAPLYLRELCIPATSVTGRQHLRSAARNDLIVPQFRTVNFGQRGFSVSGPRLWNSLPHDIRQLSDSLEQFKQKLKTYFFHKQRWH